MNNKPSQPPLDNQHCNPLTKQEKQTEYSDLENSDKFNDAISSEAENAMKQIKLFSDQKSWLAFAKILGVIFLFTVITSNLDTWLSFRIEDELSSSEGLSSAIWFYGTAIFLLNILTPVILFLAVAAFIHKTGFVSFCKMRFSLMLKEQLRTWGKIMSWSFLFFIPGLWKFIQYTFVPFIVCFDQSYLEGQVDALEQSQRISKGSVKTLLFAIFIFIVILPALTASLFDEHKLIWQTPLQSFLVCLLDMTINICFIFLLWFIFKKAGAKHGTKLSVLSMERSSTQTTGSHI